MQGQASFRGVSKNNVKRRKVGEINSLERRKVKNEREDTSDVNTIYSVVKWLLSHTRWR